MITTLSHLKVTTPSFYVVVNHPIGFSSPHTHLYVYPVLQSMCVKFLAPTCSQMFPLPTPHLQISR